MKRTWTNRKKILNKSELNHLHNEAGCRTKAQFQHTINMHKKWGVHQCVECWSIARKLGMKAE